MRKTQRLGKYHLMDRIAYGGMAEIFRGFIVDETGFRQDVAIKRLLPSYTEDGQFVQMLTDEFRVVEHLKHPNIAEVRELVEAQDSVIISMEYVDGKDLRSTVERARQRGTRLEFDDIAYVLAKVLEGLHHAHVATDETGNPLRIVHRDISPSNVLLSYDGHVKICDFGIAKAALNRVQTKTGIIKGKVKYMSPEQAFGKKLDGRSDLFSVGTVLYELCTGHSAFRASNEVDLIFAVREANPRPARDLNPEIPEELAAIINKAMARSRSARYQTGLEFRDALVAFGRKVNAGYKRTKLARLMRNLWSKEIERELRQIEEFVIADEAQKQGEPAESAPSERVRASATGSGSDIAPTTILQSPPSDSVSLDPRRAARQPAATRDSREHSAEAERRDRAARARDAATARVENNDDDPAAAIPTIIGQNRSR